MIDWDKEEREAVVEEWKAKLAVARREWVQAHARYIDAQLDAEVAEILSNPLYSV